VTDTTWLLLAFCLFQSVTIYQYAARTHRAEAWMINLARENHTLRHELDEALCRAACRGGRVVDPATLRN
jgi:hypothetical protein